MLNIFHKFEKSPNFRAKIVLHTFQTILSTFWKKIYFGVWHIVYIVTVWQYKRYVTLGCEICVIWVTYPCHWCLIMFVMKWIMLSPQSHFMSALDIATESTASPNISKVGQPLTILELPLWIMTNLTYFRTMNFIIFFN